MTIAIGRIGGLSNRARLISNISTGSRVDSRLTELHNLRFSEMKIVYNFCISCISLILLVQSGNIDGTEQTCEKFDDKIDCNKCQTNWKSAFYSRGLLIISLWMILISLKKTWTSVFWICYLHSFSCLTRIHNSIWCTT